MKKVIISISIIIMLLIMVIGIPFINLACKTNEIYNDFSSIYDNDKYEDAVMIENIDVVDQQVSCGYAVMEMFAKYIGSDLTEQSLFDEYGKVVTSTGKSFEKEMNKQFSNYHTTMYKYLRNTELIDKVYTSLSEGMPVPIEWAAKLDDEWTLHYSLVVGMDVKKDKVTILNPYNYVESITIEEFLMRTSFKAFDKMPALYSFGFAFGAFDKNTVFIVEPIIRDK